jgi:hypothetical protein
MSAILLKNHFLCRWLFDKLSVLEIIPVDQAVRQGREKFIDPYRKLTGERQHKHSFLFFDGMKDITGTGFCAHELGFIEGTFALSDAMGIEGHITDIGGREPG